MLRSTERILAARAGSLPRPKSLLDLMKAEFSGQHHDREACAREIRAAEGKTGAVPL